MDFPNEIVLEITKKDTLEGLQGDCSKCPTALALWRLYPELTDMIVDYLYIRLWDEKGEKIARYLPSKDLTVEMHLFDSNGKIINFRAGKYTLKLNKIIETKKNK